MGARDVVIGPRSPDPAPDETAQRTVPRMTQALVKRFPTGDDVIMARGTVKFWKAEKGWGAISCAELPPGRDAFAHFSDLVGSGYRSLEAGDEVEFDLVERSQDSFDHVAENIRKL